MEIAFVTITLTTIALIKIRVWCILKAKAELIQYECDCFSIECNYEKHMSEEHKQWLHDMMVKHNYWQGDEGIRMMTIYHSIVKSMTVHRVIEEIQSKRAKKKENKFIKWFTQCENLTDIAVMWYGDINIALNFIIGLVVLATVIFYVIR